MSNIIFVEDITLEVSTYTLTIFSGLTNGFIYRSSVFLQEKPKTMVTSCGSRTEQHKINWQKGHCTGAALTASRNALSDLVFATVPCPGR